VIRGRGEESDSEKMSETREKEKKILTGSARQIKKRTEIETGKKRYVEEYKRNGVYEIMKKCKKGVTKKKVK